MADLSDGTRWFETDGANNLASPNGWPEGMMPSGVNDAARNDKGALKRFWDKINPVQTITRSGSLYTFTTSNAAYPTSYVDGELYTFAPANDSVGGDQFQVNALGAKPIWKRGWSPVWVPVAAHDIAFGLPAYLIYGSSLNGGSGAFILLNPFVPAANDGAGGISLPGGVTVGGSLQVTGTINAAGIAAAGTIDVTGTNANFTFNDRDGVSQPWSWYAQGGIARLANGTNGERITVDGSGNLAVDGELFLNGTRFADCNAPGTGNNFIYDNAGHGAFLLQGGGNYYRNTVHTFQSIDGAAEFAHLDATGLHLTVPLAMSGGGAAGAISVTNVTASSTVSSVNVSASSDVTAAGSVTGGIMHSTGTMQVDGQTNLLQTLNVGPGGGWARIDGVGTYNNSGSWLTFSDRRVKEDILPYSRGLDAILALDPVTYVYRPGTPFADAERTVRLGLVAQDVLPVLPELVGKTTLAGEEVATLLPGNLVYAIINSCKELAERNTALAARVAALEADAARG